ncbi:hypothetical protein PLESTB_000781500 [Pleodorina starrii]|uniref:Nuclear speckle splicing regulatory protein 1 N-terminal domain-containing protein n=1 Tax=Pleodorina starrii TaxID=330485 RepID=A0A9W6BKL4_9CHLO|nr:hypothetical protein PLESTM_000503400 [Pleodorina starrii]GLC53733.1 hypothetical protein PLESTB_000781500 [Pleodorina starrii]
MSKQPPGIIIGQKGVRYGLQKVEPKKPGLQGTAVSQRKVAPTNVFGNDDSEEEDVERQIARQADKKRAAAKVQQMYEVALAEDPSVFDYDGVYDSIQEAREAPKQQDKVQRQSKYIASLLEQAQQRKREQDVLYERRMVKERQQEDHLYDDKERFVTSAYRRKLEEDKKWQEAERQRELEEQKNDVRKVGHMGNFYANLLTKNVAYGTAKHEEVDKKKAAAAAGAKSVGADEDAEGQRSDPEALASSSPPAGGGGSSAAAAKGAAAQGPSAKALAQLDRYDVLRLEAEKALRSRKLAEQQQHGLEKRQQQGEEGGVEEPGAGPGPRPGGGAQDSEVAEEEALGRQRQASDGRDSAPPVSSSSIRRGTAQRETGGEGQAAEVAATAAGAPGGLAGAAPTGAAVGGKRRNDETAVQSARERYLARKQQKAS